MYERFYNLRERPFALSPDPDYLYRSRVHQEALGYLRYGIESHAGFVLITGEIGSGKTTLLQTVLRGLDHQTSVARLVSTTLDAREVIEAVMLDFGLDPGQGRSKPYLIRDLARYLVEQRAAGRLALLVIDEAQNLSPSALEEIRMLSNLETEKSKLVQIVLIGQPNLRDLLARQELEQLRQRVTVSYHLRALDADETANYVNHRLRRAAIGAPLEFPREVTDLIHLHSQGVPRKINVIADAVLLFGFGGDRRVITVDLTHEVLEELEGTGVVSSPTPGAASLAPPASASADAVRAREERLNARERQLADSERAVAAAERALAEEYRVIRQRTDEAPRAPMSQSLQPPAAETPRAMRPASSAAPMTPRPPIAARSASTQEAHRRPIQPPVRDYAATLYPAVFRPAPMGLWARLRRGLLGLPKPLFEE